MVASNFVCSVEWDSLQWKWVDSIRQLQFVSNSHYKRQQSTQHKTRHQSKQSDNWKRTPLESILDCFYSDIVVMQYYILNLHLMVLGKGSSSSRYFFSLICVVRIMMCVKIPVTSMPMSHEIPLTPPITYISIRHNFVGSLHCWGR